MTTFTNILTKLRRFLRDPDGLIWTDADLMTYFNDAQLEIARKTNILERVEAGYYPPQYTYSFMFDWETAYLEGDKYQCLQVYQQTMETICYPWEAGWWMTTLDGADDGTRFTHPFESVYCSPADPVAIPLHAKFDKARFVAYDEIEITPTSERELAQQDPYYKTTTGQVSSYYRPDDYSNQLILYPRPSTITWQGEDYTESLDDAGGIEVDSEEWLNMAETGLATDVIDTDAALFMVYIAIPNDLVENTDTSDFPDWLLKYVEYATLERAFGADTDGFIPTLRDFWKARKDIGIQAIMRFKRKRLTDRDYRLGGDLAGKQKSRLKLGEHYPATYP